MPKTFFVSLLWLFSGILSTSCATAQSDADSLSNGHKLYAHIEDNFYNSIGPQSRLYNGEKYMSYSPKIKGNAYLMDNDQWNKGNILYDGFWYKNVDMLYDLYKDVVVISLYKNFFKLSLISEKVNCFDLLGHHFIYIKANLPVINPLDAGYYDQLYSGKIQLLCKRSKSIQETHNLSESIDSYFLPSTDYYIYKNGKYFTVNSKGAFLDALKDKKKYIQQFMKANKLKIKKDTKEMSMVKIAAYYDQLAN